MSIETLAAMAEDIAAEQARNGGKQAGFLSGLRVLRVTSPTRLEATVYQPVICLILQGRKETSIGLRRVEFGPGEALIVSHDLPVVSRITEASTKVPYLAVVLPIDLAMLRGLYGEIMELETGSEQGRSLDVFLAGQALLDSMDRYLALASDELGARVLGPSILREVHFRLLTAPNGGMLRQLLSNGSHASRISRAIGRIRRDFTSAIPISELAEIAGMSPSTFHGHFKSVTGKSPLQYQKDLRLIEARRLLSEEHVPVASAAYQVGYESPAQFSREYRRKFGNSPRIDHGTALVAAE